MHADSAGDLRRRIGAPHHEVDKEAVELDIVGGEVDAGAPGSEAAESAHRQPVAVALVHEAVVEVLEAALRAGAAAHDRDVGGVDENAHTALDLIGRRSDDLEALEIECLAARGDLDGDFRVRTAHRGGELNRVLTGIEEARRDVVAAGQGTRPLGRLEYHRDGVRQHGTRDAGAAVPRLFPTDGAVGMSRGGDDEGPAYPGHLHVTLTLAVTCALILGYVVVTTPPDSVQVCPLAPPLTLHLTNSGAGAACGI